MVPGDGQHVVWDALVGPSRSRYFLFMGYKLTAQEAREWGVVHEVLPRDRLLDRAWEIAREIAKRPPIVNRNTKYVLTQSLRRAFLDELHHGLQAEMWAQRQFFPFGAGHAGARPALGPEAVVRLIACEPDRSSEVAVTTTPQTAVEWPAWEDAAFYNQDPEVIYASIAAQRRAAPVYWYEPPGYPTGFWVLSKWEHQRFVGSHPSCSPASTGSPSVTPATPSTVMHQLPEWAQERIRQGS